MTLRDELIACGIPVPAEVESLSGADTVQSWARCACVSRSELGRRVRKQGALPPKFYVQLRRLLTALQLMESRNILEAAHLAGYPDPFYFSNQCVRMLGARPSAIRKAGDWRVVVRKRFTHE